MNGDVSATTALLLQRQASSGRAHVRQYAFASTIANRFYSDNSLARKQRLVECTKRRQAKALERAAEHAHRVEAMQLELAEAERLRGLKEERATARMRLKVSHVAAMYIQFVWRRRIAVRAAREQRRNRAASVVVRSLQRYARRLSHRRMVAARCIQHQWRACVSRQQLARRLRVLGRFVLRWVRARRASLQCASRIQTWFRAARRRRRAAAVCCIQRIWRRRCLWRALDGFVTSCVEKKRAEKRDRCARVLQRSIGQLTVYRRLISTPALRDYPAVMALPWSTNATSGFSSDAFALESAQDTSRKLKAREVALTAQVDQLNQQLASARVALVDEHERLRRHSAVEECRRVKDEQASSQRLQAAEASMRRQIRVEIERELETARRLMLRSKRRASRSGQYPAPAGLEAASGMPDPRVEIS